MPNAIALQGIRDVLRSLNPEDLHGLTATVTHGLLKEKRKSRHDAIEIILKYSPDILSILKRRVVTRDVLFNYLHDRSVIVELPTTKDKLVAKICELWNLPTHKDIRTSNEDVKTITSQKEIKSAESNVNVMAKQFAQWFYEMMNSTEYIEPDHFYLDARLILHLISNNTEITEETESSKSIVELLFKTKTEHNLFFNPNLNSEGIQGRLDPHGLVMVLACGTLHSNNLCVGVFEQVFALARDPYCDNNWKIKNMQLNLRSKTDNINTPSLSDNELTSSLLALPSA
ncbi:hypothetical protein MML48_1g16152 [Holotrichia oblita]|uniref:Uncharacterized protein n=1 Tax=Holotrichia oblita TaxID=644536 RepID=A0ACB9TTL5_HOLOL|nr:hypothetical protein MML48_1g16152 [Holotrichia oblita]